MRAFLQSKTVDEVDLPLYVLREPPNFYNGVNKARIKRLKVEVGIACRKWTREWQCCQGGRPTEVIRVKETGRISSAVIKPSIVCYAGRRDPCRTDGARLRCDL